MIFYFSGTGNTRWVAEQIAQAIGEELLYIPDLIREGRYEFTLKEGERIGFCFPTHGWQPPRIVREFVRRTRIESNNAFCWALTTCGDSMGETMKILNKELSTIGIQAETLFSVIMPESYVCLPFMYTDTEEREKEKIENAQRQLRHIISIVKDRKRGVEELEQGATPRLYSYVIGGYFNKQMISDRKFTVDEDVCILCGKCAKVCPVDNIKGTPPVWLHNGKCTCCLACYHYCPVHAINYGSITKKRDQYYFGRQETGVRRQETGVRRQESVDRSQ
ncbi:MAG: EFR1 family ferrodoxin [Prevotella sp.]|nr:EFR1 family ferrodoxin [Prevotella sp.]